VAATGGNTKSVKALGDSVPRRLGEGVSAAFCGAILTVGKMPLGEAAFHLALSGPIMARVDGWLAEGSLKS
jgi:hypothetical protein